MTIHPRKRAQQVTHCQLSLTFVEHEPQHIEEADPAVAKSEHPEIMHDTSVPDSSEEHVEGEETPVMDESLDETPLEELIDSYKEVPNDDDDFVMLSSEDAPIEDEQARQGYPVTQVPHYL
jgi:hypothetical protein